MDSIVGGHIEVSLLLIYERVSADWHQGCHPDSEGLKHHMFELKSTDWHPGCHPDSEGLKHGMFGIPYNFLISTAPS